MGRGSHEQDGAPAPGKPEENAGRVLDYRHTDRRPSQEDLPFARPATAGPPRSVCEAVAGVGPALLRFNRRLTIALWVMAALVGAYSGFLYLTESAGYFLSKDAVVVFGRRTEMDLAFIIALVLVACAFGAPRMGLGWLVLSRGRAKLETDCAIAIVREPSRGWRLGRMIDAAVVMIDRASQCVQVEGMAYRYCIYNQDITFCRAGVGVIRVEFVTAEGPMQLVLQDDTPDPREYKPIPRELIRLCVKAWPEIGRQWEKDLA